MVRCYFFLKYKKLNLLIFTKALVGIAFSVGFVLGPLIGAMFAQWSYTQESYDWFVVPASLALGLAVMDFIFVALFFKETLPKVKVLSTIKKHLMLIQRFTFGQIAFEFCCQTSMSIFQNKRAKNVVSSVSQAIAYINFFDLINFNAVTNLTKESMNHTILSKIVYLGIYFLNRQKSAAPHWFDVFLVPVPLLWSGVHFDFSDLPRLRLLPNGAG